MDRKVIGAVAVVAVVRKDTVELRRNHEGKAPCDMVRRIGPVLRPDPVATDMWEVFASGNATGKPKEPAS